MSSAWDDGEEYEDHEEQEEQDAPSDCSERAVTQMDPLELRFSQRKMRNVFADGKLIADSVKQVRPVRRTAEEQSIYGAPYRLEAPFPPIEVLRFRCKLRDETTGRPLQDPVTKKEMFEKEESWFTLDNRRLYCLQRVAVNLLPERCTVDTVAEIRKERRLREIRKFRTLDGGRSINVGSVVDGVPFQTWSWMEEAQNPRKSDEVQSGAKANPGDGEVREKGKGGVGARAKGEKGEKGRLKGEKGKARGKGKDREYGGYGGYAWIDGKKGKGKGELPSYKGKGWQVWWQEPWAYMDYWGSAHNFPDYESKGKPRRKGSSDMRW